MKFPLVLALLISVTALAGDPVGKKIVTAPEEDGWRFTLAVPGWMAGVTGDVGIGPAIGSVDVGFGTLLPKIDMIWATRAEASKGRFGILGELVYLSMSDGAGPEGMVQKVDVRVDEYLGDLAVRWRVLEGPRGYLDILAGVRYTNLYQQVGLQANDEEIDARTTDFVDEIGERLRASVEERLGDDQFRNALVESIDERITGRLVEVTGPEPRERPVHNAPLAKDVPRRIGRIVERLVRQKKAELLANTLQTARAAATAEIAAVQATAAAASSTARARATTLRAQATALRATVNQRIAAAKSDLQKQITQTLESSLNQRVARVDDWWDPYLGLRARYNLNDKFYIIARGDIGGFGVGSDLMWQAEGALGVQLTQQVYAEIGYRALSFDYDKDGLTYDTITHGAQMTLGLQF
jgi:hypothetical protein